MTRRRLAAATAVGITVGLALAVIPAVSASAHPSETSAVLVTINEADIELEMQIPLDRYVLATDSTIEATDSSVSEHLDELDSYVLEYTEVSDADGSLVESIDSIALDTVNDVPSLIVELTATASDGSVDGDVTLTDGVVSERIATHDIYVTLVSDFRNGSVAEGGELLGVLSRDDATITLDRAAASSFSGFLATVKLGVTHIAEGTDHLVFLAMLVLAGVGGRARERRGHAGANRRSTTLTRLRRVLPRTALIATAFTLGHSITLALVTFGVLDLPTTLVEALVAASIVVAAAHAAFPIVPRAEIAIAAVFGLVHGAAFATTLIDLDLEPSALLAALVGFNLGVEAAQLLAIIVALPLLAFAQRSRWFPALRLALAGLGAVAGALWLVGILTGEESILQPVFDVALAHPVASLAAVASVFVLFALATPQRRRAMPRAVAVT